MDVKTLDRSPVPSQPLDDRPHESFEHCIRDLQTGNESGQMQYTE